MSRYQVYAKGAILYRICDIEDAGIAVPAYFRKCVKCSLEAKYIDCLSLLHFDGVNWEPKNPSVREFVELLRETTGCNFEVPLCEYHRDFGALPN